MNALSASIWAWPWRIWLWLSWFRPESMYGWIIVFIYAGFTFETYGQIQPSAEFWSTAKKDRLNEIYEGFNAGSILTGRRYPMSYPGVEGSQYLIGDHLMMGELVYDGIRFEDIQIQYDLYKQYVVVKVTGMDFSTVVSLDSRKVSQFRMDSLRFMVYQDSVLQSGIYQVLFQGPTTRLMVKRSKEFEIDATDSHQYFRSVNRYYLVNGKDTTPVNGRRELMRALADHAELKSFVKQNQIKFDKQHWEESLIRCLTFYDAD